MLNGFRNIGQAREEAHHDFDGAARQSVGDMLRTRRDEYGLDLRDVSNALRIRFPYLVAIEEGRLDDLPGATYAIGFVRAYADHLGLDGPAVVERYKNETAALADDAQLIFPSPLPEGKVPSGTILLVAVLALVAIYGGWVLLTTDSRRLAELVPALPDQFLALIGLGDAAPSEETNSTPPTASAEERVTAQPSEDATSETTGGSPTAHLESPETRQPAPSGGDAASGNAETAPAVAPPVTQPVTPVPVTAEPAVESEQNTDGNTAQPIVVAPDRGTAVQAATDAAEAAADSQVASKVVPAIASGDVASTAAATPESAAPNAQSSEPLAAESTALSDAAAAPEKTPAENAGTGNDVPRPEPEAVRTAAVTATQPAPPAAPSEGTKEPRKYGAENADARVVIRATGESWVQVRDKEGNLLLTRVLRVGDSYRVPNDAGLVMRTGNAGGLEIRVDGESVPALGPTGAIRHEVALDAELLKAGTAITR